MITEKRNLNEDNNISHMDNCINKYLELVEIGKVLYSKIENYQVKIVKLALDACDIRHGGISTNIYTISDYANDIGMSSKTLQNWIGVYKNVVIPINLDIKDASDWSAARVTNDLLKIERTVTNKKNGESGSLNALKDYKKNIPVKKVKQIFDDIKSNKKNEFHVTSKAIKAVKHVGFSLSEMDMDKVSDILLIELMERLDTASDLINDHLTDKRARTVL